MHTGHQDSISSISFHPSNSPNQCFLCKIGLVNDPKCSFCKIEDESMKHLMWSCKIISELWKDFLNWLRELNIIVNINYWNVCFGIYDREYHNFLNMVILLMKRFIYKSRVQEKEPRFDDFKNWVSFIETVEKHIAKKNDKYALHLKKWEPFFN